MADNPLLKTFRIRADLAIATFLKQMEALIQDDLALGISKGSIASQRTDDTSRWNTEKAKMVKGVKGAAAGLVNRVHIKSYTKNL